MIFVIQLSYILAYMRLSKALFATADYSAALKATIDAMKVDRPRYNFALQ